MIRTSYCGGFPFCIEKEQGMSSPVMKVGVFSRFFAPSEKIGTTFRILWCFIKLLLTEKRINVFNIYLYLTTPLLHSKKGETTTAFGN